MKLTNRFARNDNRKKTKERKLRCLESLEPRQLMAADIQASLTDGILRIVGSEQADTIVVRRADQTTYVDSFHSDAGMQRTAMNGEVNRIEIEGQGGNDFIEVPDVHLVDGIHIQGGKGTDIVVAPDSASFVDPEPSDQYFASAAGTPSEYYARARTELTRVFTDEHGFTVTWTGTEASDIGEATYFTAVAATGIAAGTFKLEGSALDASNAQLTDLLSTLLDGAWSTPNSIGRSHPIRHPEDLDYVKRDGELVVFRQSPLAKDGFGQILTAAFYSYTSPATTPEVKQRARDVIQKLSEFLVINQWRLDPAVETRTLFDSGGKPKNRQPEAYVLFPHERYALQNVASRMGLVTSHWNIWEGLDTTMIQEAADVVASLAGQALEAILREANVSMPYDIQVGPDRWNVPHIKGSLDISISAGMRQSVVRAFEDVIRETVRAHNLAGRQSVDLVGLAVNRILNLLPEAIGPDSWRTVLTTAIQQTLPWLSRDAWIEAATFIVSIQGMKAQNVSSVGYSVWSFAAEMEARPEMADLLRPFVKEYYYNFLRPIAGNDNALWAWLAGDGGRVSEHLTRFESEVNPRRWDDYAWHRKADDFFGREDAADSNKRSSRLDYVALRGLHAHGAPQGLSGIATSWRDRLVGAVDGAVDRIIEATKAEWRNLTKNLGALASALKNELQLGMDRIAKILWDVRPDLGDVAKALHKHVSGNLGEIAKTLRKQLNARFDQIASVLFQDLKATPVDLAKILAKHLDRSPLQVAGDLYKGSVGHVDVAKALYYGLGRNTFQVAADLYKGSGMGYKNVAKALYHGLGRNTFQVAADLYKGSGMGYKNVAKALYYGLGRNTFQVAADLYKGSGMGYKNVAKALYYGLGRNSFEVAADLRRGAGLSLHNVARALYYRSGLDLSFNQTASALYNGVGGISWLHALNVVRSI